VKYLDIYLNKLKMAKKRIFDMLFQNFIFQVWKL